SSFPTRRSRLRGRVRRAWRHTGPRQANHRSRVTDLHPQDQLQTSQPSSAAGASPSATVTLQDQREALALLGAGDTNLRRMRELTRAKLVARGETVTITGDAAEVQQAERMVRDALDVVRG